ncbi:MAG: peptidyl-prolyl cis-trans isomerase [bacterium]
MICKEKFDYKKTRNHEFNMFIYTYIVIFVSLLALNLFQGCSNKKNKVLAKVNGEEILASDFIEFYNTRPRIAGWSSKEGRLDHEEVLNGLVEKFLMAQKAKSMGLDSSPYYKEQLNKIEEKLLVNIFVQKWFDPKVHIKDEEVQKAIPEYQKKEVLFARICVLNENDAWEIKRKLDQGEDFSNLARTRSIGIDAENGGVGDFLSPHRGIYHKSVIEVIFNLPIGEVSKPQKIREGYALFKPIKERPLNSDEMEQVIQYQRSLLSRERKNILIREFLEKAKKERNLIVFHDAIKKIPSQKRNHESPFFNPILLQGEGIEIQWRDLKENLPKSIAEDKKQIWEDPDLLNGILDTMTNKRLMVLEARKAGFEKDPELKKELDRFEQDILGRQLMMYEIEKKLAVTGEECRKYYQENLIRFFEPEMVRASHILLKDKEKAEEILFKLKKGEEFAALAESSSEYKMTSGKGGDMGYIKSGESGMGKKFDQVAFSLKIGEISELVETPFGYQIITVTDRKPDRTIPFEEVQDKIRQELINERRKILFDDYLKSLRKEAKIEINKDLLYELIPDLGGKGA